MTRLALVFLLLATLGAQAQGVLNRGNSFEPDSLDPHFAGTTAESNIIGDLLVGLTTFDAAAKPIPGIAERWETTQDGLTWTFHLRKAQWSNGDPVTAQDFVWSWQRMLDPKTAGRSAQNLWVLKNARAISGGKLPVTALGARAPDARTVVVTLEHPAPYLPELMAFTSALPVPRKLVEAKGNGWSRPGVYVSNGPYALKDWRPGDHVTLVKNPRFYDAARVRIGTVNFHPTVDTQAALRRLRAGELDLQTPLPSAQVEWLRANMPRALHIVPSLAIAYMPMNLRDPALKDIRVRRALNLVYDREAVAQKVMKLGETPAYAFVPPGIANYAGGPRLPFQSTPMPARVAEARKLMQEAGYGPFNKLRLTLDTTGNPDNRRIAAVFQAMARQIYVDVQIRVSDYQVMLKAMRQGQFQLGLNSWLADFDDASNFLDLLRTGSPTNYAGYSNPKFDAAMERAAAQPDTNKRRLLLQAAERIAQADLPWVVIRNYSQSEAVAPRVGGYVPNPRMVNRSRWLWLK